jgi:vacuolar-type H+-ATPase catalytic subunit A/Vma1
MRFHEFKSEINEGADFYGYFKTKDGTYSYPKNMEFEIGHVSNVTARSILSSIGLDADFENTSPYPIDDFLQTTQKYLDTNAANKDTVQYDNVEAIHKEASRFKKQHPEITHVGFN